MVILYILISGLFFLLMVMISSYVTFQYLEENYTWISREWRLLDALSKDFQTAYRAVDQTKRRASQVWKTELNLRGLTLKLSQIETRWVKKAGKVGSDAKRWAEELERLMAERREMDVVQRHVLVLKKVALIFELAFGLDRTKGDIKNQLEKNKKYTNYIIGLLEDSRIKVRRVQDRPIDDSRKSRVPAMLHPGPVVPLVLERLINETPNYLVGGSEMVEQIRVVLIQLQLLEAFMRDLRGLRLESNIESVWLEEAREINVQVRYDIKTFLVAASNQNRNVFIGWIWRRKFKQILKHVASELSHLLELKERYGFTFIKRVSSKGYAFMIPLPPNQTRIMDKIRSELIGMQDDQLINSLCSELEDAQKLLTDQEANQGATETRMACFELLKKRLKDTLKLLKDDEKALIAMRRAGFQLLKKMAPNAVSSREKKIKSLQKVVGLLKKCIQVYMINVVEDSCSVVGLEEDIHKLVWKLTADSEQGSIISIVGMRGIGKTTLAKKICTHRLVINRFSVCRLVSIREEYHHNNTLLLKGFGNQILDTQDERPEKEYGIKKIKDFLKEKCCLIVLDNLFSKEAWDYLHKHALVLEEMGNGSKIMLTTRSKAVATHANPSSTSIHRLRLRNREESWEFFTQMVHCPDTGLETLAKEVVARTGGLPLAILHLGYLLSWEKVTKEELSRALERVSQGQNQTPWLENRDIYLQLQSSSTVLDGCLSYFELFPRDFEVPVKRLVALWVAQGLDGQSKNAGNIEVNQQQHFRDNTDQQSHENAAYNFLSELIDLNIVQIVNRKLNGEVKRCCFPRTLREVLSEGRRNSEIVRSWSLYTSSNRQLAYLFDDKDTSYNGGIHGLDSDIVSQHDGYPTSIMVFDTREGPDPGEDIGKFLLNGIRSGRFLDLVVLDLRGIFRPHLPSTIGRLKRLKFLGLRWTFLESLPSSICKLLHLQTLDLKYTMVRTLPFSIWKLKKLQHLHLNRNCRIKFMPQPNAISMENLQVLSGVFVDHEGIALTNRLHKLSNLRRLELTFQLTKPQQEVLATCIRQLTHLNSLRLRSLSETAEPQDLILDNCLKDLTKLSRLHLMGKLELESLIELPESLSELSLSASRLSGSVNSLLGKLSTLPQLESLSFFGDSYCEPEMVFPKGFSKLLVLKIWKLDNLRKLVVEEEAMQKLREFEIRSCGVLEHTIGLTHLKTLQELKLTNMPATHAAAIEMEFTAAYKEQYADNVSYRLIKINNGQFGAQFS